MQTSGDCQEKQCDGAGNSHPDRRRRDTSRPPPRVRPRRAWVARDARQHRARNVVHGERRPHLRRRGRLLDDVQRAEVTPTPTAQRAPRWPSRSATSTERLVLATDLPIAVVAGGNFQIVTSGGASTGGVAVAVGKRPISDPRRLHLDCRERGATGATVNRASSAASTPPAPPASTRLRRCPSATISPATTCAAPRRRTGRPASGPSGAGGAQRRHLVDPVGRRRRPGAASWPTPNNTRWLHIFGGQLYVSTASARRALPPSRVPGGTGLPMTAGQTANQADPGTAPSPTPARSRTCSSI